MTLKGEETLVWDRVRMRTTRRRGSRAAKRAIEKTQAQKRPRSLSQSLTLPMLG